MPRPRKSLICLDNTSYYHCVSRCVRRAFLCGKDKFSGRSYEHRRQWVEERLLFLAEVFAIDVCAYAVMSNHTHVVLHVNKKSALAWSDEEVLLRWHKLHRGMLLTKRYLNPSDKLTMTSAEIQTVAEIAERYRNRLFDISWFMRLLNEYIARQANKEDECTGRFWEGRFKSQAILDEASLAACMVYVDLNPVRAGIADSPEHARYTSGHRRIYAAKNGKQPEPLFPLVGSSEEAKQDGLPFVLGDYLHLLKETSSLLHSPISLNKNINPSPILARAGVSSSNWGELVAGVEKRFSTIISLKVASRRFKHKAPGRLIYSRNSRSK